MALLVIAVIAGLAAAIAAAVLVGLAATRAAGARAEARAAAALDAHIAELDLRLAGERERSVTAAAEMAARLAGEKLGDHLQAGAAQLDLRTKGFDDKVAGLAGELQRMGDLVTRLQQERAAQHTEFLTGLKQATTASTALAETTQHLREALASPKARGQWGERMCDDVLRLAGMVEGVTYRKQTAIDGGTIPDVTFLLPGGRELHMDVKFPVDNYLRHLEAGTDHERDAAAGAFLKDVRARVKELSGRGYIQPDSTLDEVLLFIPNESVWAFIHERDPQLIDVALRQKVVLCSPVSLFAVLAVIRQAVEQVRLERTSDEILECLTGFGQQWEKFTDALDRVGRQFDTAHRGLGDLAGPRRRQLERQLDRIDDLRARRGLPDPTEAVGDGEGEALRRSTGDIRILPGA
jgi:DNA recombination protein RmuC